MNISSKSARNIMGRMRTKIRIHHVLMGTIFLVIAVPALVLLLSRGMRASAVPISDSSTAAVLNTSQLIYFDSGTYGANATIDNYSRAMSGYAWSPDIGWIYFGSGGDNAQGPVVASTSGNLSGKAKALNGGYIDFNASPYGSNVTVTTPGGDFAGYAWSEDLGWIDFGNVLAPDYNPDLLAPDNPATVTTKSAADGTVLTDNSWYNHTAPYFEWVAPSDNASGITPSGVAGYYVYFGTSNSTDPTSYQTATNFTSPEVAAGPNTYYFRIKTKDVSGNISDPVTLFTYKYEDVEPTPPLYVSVDPAGYSNTNSFTFSWPVSGGNAAADSGGSGLAGYRYKINSEGTWHDVAGDENTSEITLNDVAVTGLNTFDLQAVDGANNAGTSVRTNFYFNDSIPTAPRDLTATPSSSLANSFAFSWTPPPGLIAGYYYSINLLPTESNASFTTNTSLAAGPYATQQGENTFYIVAKDTGGGYDLSSCNNITGNPAVDSCAKVTFTANTTAPGIPTSVQAHDISDRAAQDYATAVKWVEPTEKGTGSFSGYDVYRSTDGNTYSKIGSTTGTVYADGGLSSQKYYYYVKAKDTAGRFSAASSVVFITPTGKYTTPPTLVSGPTYAISPTSLVVKWATNRECSSFVQIRDGNTFVSEQGQTDQTTDHEVRVVGLRSQQSYSFIIKSTDVDGNILSGPEKHFQTANTPSVYDLNITNVTQTSAIINFKSTAIADFTLYWGTTADFGNTIKEKSGDGTTNHSMALTGLKPGGTYFFRVMGYDADDNEIRSENSFSTLPMPAISNFEIQPVKDAPTTTLTLFWQTNVPTTSTAKYSTKGVKMMEKSISEMTTSHKITIEGLADNSNYDISVSGRDKFGNEATSNKTTFETPKDSRAPKISDIIIETSNVGNISSGKAQVAISWKTDEPATSQIEYAEGLGGDDYTNKTNLDKTYTNNHLVIISDLNPSKPYHIRILTSDLSENVTKSGDNTIITGDVSRSILQIIFTTLQNIFGWLSS